MRFRTLRNIAIGVGVGIPALVTLMVADQRPMPLGVLLLSGVVGVGTGFALYTLAQRRLQRAYLAAGRSDDARELRRVFEEIVDANDGKVDPLHEALVLARERRFAEAVARLDTVDLRTRARHQGYYLTARSFCAAHVGPAVAALAELERGLALVTDATQRMELARLRGMVLALAGRHEEAMEALRDSEARAGTSFYIALAHRGLGNVDQAIAAYERVLALPEGDPLRDAARAELDEIRSRRAFR